MIDDSRVRLETLVVAKRLNLSPEERQPLYAADVVIQKALPLTVNSLIEEDSDDAIQKYMDITAPAYSVINAYAADYIMCFEKIPLELREVEIYKDVEMLGLSKAELYESFNSNNLALVSDSEPTRPLTYEEIRARVKASNPMKFLPCYTGNNEHQRIVQTYLQRIALKEYGIIGDDGKTNQLPIAADKLEWLLSPTDPINQKIWRNLPMVARNEYEIPVTPSKLKNKKDLTVSIVLDFTGLQDDVRNDATIPEPVKDKLINALSTLTALDQRIFFAAATFYANGNAPFSLSQLHAAIGNKGRPSGAQLERYMNSLRKMLLIHIAIDNRAEAQALKHRAFYQQEGTLLSWRGTLARDTKSGKIIRGAIELLSKPILFDFAEQRKQITVIPRGVLESPVDKTERNLAIEQYLLWRITAAKQSRLDNFITYADLFEKIKVSDSDRSTKARIRDVVKRLLEHYKGQKFIAEYKVETTKGVRVLF